MRRLLGPHVAGQWANKLEIIRKWQPPLVLVLQPEVEKVQQLREACPNAVVVGRFYHDDSHYANNIDARPIEFAAEIHNEIVSHPVTPLLDYVQSNNETNQDWEGIQKLNQYTQEWMALADQSGVYKCAILAFSVGNPDMPFKTGDPAGFNGRMLYWQQVLPSLNYAQHHDHILLLHAYGYPDMFHPDADWYIYRYERQVQDNLKTLGITNLKYAYGEIGIDRLIVDGRGGYQVVPTSDQGYVNQTLQWERDLQGQDLLLGGTIFTFGDSGGWNTYDIASTDVASMIADHYVSHVGDYDTSDVEDDDHDVFIPAVGTGGTPVPQPERNVDPRAIERGVRVETPSMAPGQQYWFADDIRWYDEQEADQLGPDHHIMVDVLDKDDQRVVGQGVVIKWPTDQDTIFTEAKPGEPYAVGFGMSPSRNEYSTWVEDGLPSEKVTGIGMGAETPSGFNRGIHTSTGVKFKKRVVASQTTPAPDSPTAIVITTAGANIRSGPGREYPTLGAVVHGTHLPVIGRNADSSWWQVQSQWGNGWVANVVVETHNVANVPVVTVPPPDEDDHTIHIPGVGTGTPSAPAPTGIIDPRVAQAILAIESGGRTHGENGKPLIRFEAHIFEGRAGDTAHFRYNQQKPWADQEWRRSEGDAWRPIHTGKQADEYAAFEFARSLNTQAAHESISMGAGQIMGFNHARVGFPSAEAMLRAFDSAPVQTIAFINYFLSDPALVQAMQRKDWREIAKRYNGAGAVDTYAPLLEKAYKELGS